MGRGSFSGKGPYVKPVRSIELSEKHFGLRIAAVIVLIVIGAGALAYGFTMLLKGNTGWQTIDPGAIRGYSYSKELIFEYNVENASDNKKLSSLYKSLLERICPLFEAGTEYKGIANIHYINRHINEQIVVDELLYSAFEKIAENGFRTIYTAPFYGEYRSIFFCDNDLEAKEYDPAYNGDAAERAKKFSDYAKDPQSVDIKLLGKNTVMLFVSDEYKKYAEDNGCSSYIDLWLIKNAFIVDYCADILINAGYENGRIHSFDGFLRNFDRGEQYVYPVNEVYNGVIIETGRLNYEGVIALADMRRYSTGDLDDTRYFSYSDGTVRTAYLDADDCIDRTFNSEMTVYSYDKGCADIVFDALRAYIGNENDPAFPDTSSGIYCVYGKDEKLYYNEKGASITNTRAQAVYFK